MKDLSQDDLIIYLKKVIRTASHAIEMNKTYHMIIADDEVIIRRVGSFPLGKADEQALRDSLEKLIGTSPTFKISEVAHTYFTEIKFKKESLNLEMEVPEIFAKRPGSKPMPAARAAETIPRDLLYLLGSLPHTNKREMPTPKSHSFPQDQKALDHELILMFLNDPGFFDNAKMMRLLSAGASPTNRISVQEGSRRAQILTASHLALEQWALEHQFMRDTPFDNRRQQLKRFSKEEPVPKETAACKSRQETYEYLFGEKPEQEDMQSKDKVMAIKNILVDCAQLLASPQRCIPLFEIIEGELEKEWVKNHGVPIPLLDEKNYTIHCHDTTLYPVPNEGYDKKCFIKKNSILQKTVYRMMCEIGLVTMPPQKWIQGIPKKISMEHLRDNVFFVEDTASPTGLAHGKMSHNIQRLLICLAIREKIINMQVDNFHITMEDLFGALMDPQYANKETKALLWQRFFDRRNFSEITFSDPHRLHSFLMTSAQRNQFRLMSDCMIHSFCNGLVKISEVLNKLHRENFWNPRNVWDNILSCMQTELFFDFKANLDQKRRKGFTLPVISEGKNYAILEKDYGQNPELEKYYSFINDNLQHSGNLPNNVVEIIHQYHDTATEYRALSKQGMFAKKRVVEDEPAHLKSLSI